MAKHVRGWARYLVMTLALLGRPPMSFAVAAGLFVAVLGPSAPVRADPPPDPAARLQFIIKQIDVRNDRDEFGSGEMRVHLTFCPTGPIDYQCRGGDGFEATYDFSANSGDLVTVDRLMPRAGDTLHGDVSFEAGVPVYAGQTYILSAHMIEMDPIGSDDMGSVNLIVTDADGWSIGTYEEEGDHSSAGGANHVGDYTMTIEVRRAPLPDLHVRGYHIVPGEPRFYCAQIENIGQRPSDLVDLNVRVDQSPLRTVTLPAVAPGQMTEHCVARTEIPPGEHALWFAIDEQRQLPELDETNNVAGLGISAVTEAPPGPGASVSPTPRPTPGAGKAASAGDEADLTVKTIRVNGQAPDGKNDCTDGKNAVIVVVKNAGKGDAGTFAVRLSVDGDTFDATVDPLPAGEEREVSFDNIALKKGGHTLKAAADLEHAIAESKDDNNGLTVTARCTAVE